MRCLLGSIYWFIPFTWDIYLVKNNVYLVQFCGTFLIKHKSINGSHCWSYAIDCDICEMMCIFTNSNDKYLKNKYDKERL